MFQWTSTNYWQVLVDKEREVRRKRRRKGRGKRTKILQRHRHHGADAFAKPIRKMSMRVLEDMQG